MRPTWSRWLACCVAFSLVVQGLTVAAERIAPRGHFHFASLLNDHYDDDDDDHHRHGGHFHAGIGYHEHEAHDRSVVYVDDGHDSSRIETGATLKRLALDHEQLAAVPAIGPTSALTEAPFLLLARALHSHAAEPLEPPPRMPLA
jgi:hypothetical protein